MKYYMNNSLTHSLKSLTIGNTQNDESSIFYMLGRFQPFTMGHLALFNEMIISASKNQDSEAYLFVSYKKPNFSRKLVPELDSLLQEDTPSLKKIKPLMKKEKSIMDNPLTTHIRVQIVTMILKSIYGSNLKKLRESIEGDSIYMVDTILDVEKMSETGKKQESMVTLLNPVKVHIIDSQIMGTGGFKAHGFLKSRYGREVKARMMTGTNREGRLAPFIMANKPIFVKREEANTSDSFHPSSLSGSKIRSWSVIYFKTHDESMLSNISNSYYGIVSNQNLKKYIVNPISNSIFDGEMVEELSSSETVSASGSQKKSQKKRKPGKRPSRKRIKRFTLRAKNINN